LNKSELFQLCCHQADEEAATWIPDRQVLLRPDDAAFIEGLRQRPENMMVKNYQVERR
jgi:hypothetical protein